MGLQPTDMPSPGNFLSRIIFWSYERGTLPYDLAVAAIVVFVLLTPRTWFHDRPQSDLPSQQALIAHVATDEASGTQTYLVDPRLLASPIPHTELEHQLHDAVRKNVPELRGRPFQIVGYEPELDQDGNVAHYRVTVKQ